MGLLLVESMLVLIFAETHQIRLQSQLSLVLLVEVYLGVQVEFYLKGKAFLLGAGPTYIHQVHLLVLPVLLLVYGVEVPIIGLLQNPLFFSTVVCQNLTLLALVLGTKQSGEEFPESIPHGVDEQARKEPQFMAALDMLQIFQLIGMKEEFLNVGHHIESAVMSVGLPGEQQLVVWQVILSQIKLNILFVLELELQIIPYGLHHKLLPLEHTVAVHDLASGILGDEGVGVEHKDTEPMSESIDGKHQPFLFEYVKLLRPPLHILIAFPGFYPHLIHQVGRLLIIDVLLLAQLPDQFVHEEGGEDVCLLVSLNRQVHKLDELDIRSNYDIVEVILGLKLLHVLVVDGEGLALVQ